MTFLNKLHFIIFNFFLPKTCLKYFHIKVCRICSDLPIFISDVCYLYFFLFLAGVYQLKKKNFKEPTLALLTVPIMYLFSIFWIFSIVFLFLLLHLNIFPLNSWDRCISHFIMMHFKYMNFHLSMALAAAYKLWQVFVIRFEIFLILTMIFFFVWIILIFNYMVIYLFVLDL